jgi:hypothetical protein
MAATSSHLLERWSSQLPKDKSRRPFGYLL